MHICVWSAVSDHWVMALAATVVTGSLHSAADTTLIKNSLKISITNIFLKSTFHCILHYIYIYLFIVYKDYSIYKNIQFIETSR